MSENHAPIRITRRRTPGWRTPLCTCGCGQPAIYVGRPTKWGNPFSAMECGGRYPSLTAEQVAGFIVNQFRYDLRGTFPDYPSANEIRAELAGHDLMCWCAERSPCHGDVLLELASQGGEQP